MKITGTKKKFIGIGFLLILLDSIYFIWLGIFINIHLLVVIIGLFPISIIEGLFILYYYSKSIRKIDVSIYQGKGTKNDPIIINSISSIPSHPILFRMKNLNIVLKNLELDDLGIYYSKNIIIENCSFRDINIYKSEAIEVKDSSISKSLSVSNCIKVSIDSSEIWQLKLNRNLFSIYQNNHIDKFVHISKEKPNSNNVYRNNIINQDVPLN